MEESLHRLRRAGLQPRRAVDVGAYRGDWTRVVKRVFPAVRVLMVEPQESMAPSLRYTERSLPDVEVEFALLGSRVSSAVEFLLDDTGSRIAAPSDALDSRMTIPMTTLDELLSRRPSFDRPDLIKLDVQGAELDVLTGAAAAMAAAEVVIMEVSLIGLIPEAPSFAQVVTFMDDAGFQLYDIAGFIRRPHDGAPWQLDAVFVRSSSNIVVPCWDCGQDRKTE